MATTRLADLTVAIDAAEFERIRRAANLTRTRFAVAVRTAANKTARGGRTKVRRAVRENVRGRLKASVVNDAVQYKPANYRDLTADVITNRRPVPLIEYKPTVSRATGVAVVTLPDKGTMSLRNAFRGRVDGVAGTPEGGGGTGHLGIFSRYKAIPTKKTRDVKGKTYALTVTPRGVSGALPIKELYGPPVLSHLTQQGQLTRLGQGQVKDIHADFRRNMASQIQFLLSGKADKLVDAQEEAEANMAAAEARRGALTPSRGGRGRIR